MTSDKTNNAKDLLSNAGNKIIAEKRKVQEKIKNDKLSFWLNSKLDFLTQDIMVAIAWSDGVINVQVKPDAEQEKLKI